MPTPNSGVHAMMASPDLGIWFTEIFINQIVAIISK